MRVEGITQWYKEKTDMGNDQIFFDIKNIGHRDTAKFWPLTPGFLQKGRNTIPFFALAFKVEFGRIRETD